MNIHVASYVHHVWGWAGEPSYSYRLYIYEQAGSLIHNDICNAHLVATGDACHLSRQWKVSIFKWTVWFLFKIKLLAQSLANITAQQCTCLAFSSHTQPKLHSMKVELFNKIRVNVFNSAAVYFKEEKTFFYSVIFARLVLCFIHFCLIIVTAGSKASRGNLT